MEKNLDRPEKLRSSDRSINEGQLSISDKKSGLIDFFKKLRLVNIIWILLLSVIFASCFFSFVNSFIVPKVYEDTVITVKESGYVGIFGINGEDPTKEIFDSAEKVGNWEFRDKAEWPEYCASNICIINAAAGNSITLRAQYIQNEKLTFWKNSDGAVIEITHKGQKKLVDTFSDISGGELSSINIPNNLTSLILLMAVIYLCLVLLTAVFIILILYLADNQGYRLVSTPKFSCAKLVLILFVLSYAFNLINYKLIGIPHLLEFGDQCEYWYRADIFYNLLSSPHSSEQITGFFIDYPVFRGYFCYMLPFISICAGHLTGMDPMFVYLLILAVITALFFGYVMPEFYRLFNNKNPSYAHSVLMLLLFGIFWRGQFYNVLCDYPGVFAFFGGSLFLLKFLKEKKIGSAILCGILFSLSLSLRTSYIVGVTAAIITAAAMDVVSKKKNFFKELLCSDMLWKTAAGIVCFLILCIPQVWINATKSHIGLFAYDEMGAYDYEDTTLLESSISRSLGNNITGYPYVINDKQIADMRDIAGFDREKHLKMDEAFYIYASSPLDSLLAMFKRAFAVMDTKNNESYPLFYYHKHSFFYLYSTVNYLILGTALFCLVNKRFRKKEMPFYEFLCLGVPIIAAFLPILAGAVEWRHGLSIYILAYYLTAYYFFDVLADAKKNRLIFNSNYFIFITCYVFLSQVLSLTMFA